MQMGPSSYIYFFALLKKGIPAFHCRDTLFTALFLFGNDHLLPFTASTVQVFVILKVYRICDPSDHWLALFPSSVPPEPADIVLGKEEKKNDTDSAEDLAQSGHMRPVEFGGIGVGCHVKNVLCG